MTFKARTAFAVLLAAVATVAGGGSLARPAAGATATNSAPDVVPSIREWTGGSGSFELGASSRIVADSSDLLGEAKVLREDLSAVTGLELQVVNDKNPHPGDLSLSDHGAPAEVGFEG